MGVNMPEKWLPVTGFEGRYEVSSYGRVRSLDRIVLSKKNAGFHLSLKGRILSQSVKNDRSKSNYFVVGIWDDGKQLLRQVHRLVCEAFHGPCPDGMQCAHLNGDSECNAPENLAWVTPKENHAHMKLHGTHRQGTDIHFAKLDNAIVAEIIARHIGGEMQKDIARSYGVCRHTVQRVVSEKTWKHVQRLYAN